MKLILAIFSILNFAVAKAQVTGSQSVQEGYTEFSKLTPEEAQRLQKLQQTLDQDKDKRLQIREAMAKILNMLETSELFDFRWGINATIAFSAPMAPQYSIEAVQLERGVLALYCAPGVNFTTDVGAGVSMSLIKTTGCYKHEDYTGNFFSAALNFAPLPGLSFLTNIGYGWGSNMDGFLNNLNEKIEAYQFDPGKVTSELRVLWAWIAGELKNKLQASVIKSVACRLLQSTPQLKGVDVSAPQDCGPQVPSDHTPVSVHQAKENLAKASEILNSQELRPENIVDLITSSRYLRLYAPNLVALFESFEGTFSGCNAISIGGGLVGKSLVPASISGSITHYTYGMAYDFNMHKSLKQLLKSSEGRDGKIELTKIPKNIVKEFLRTAEGTYNGVKTLMTCEASNKAMLYDAQRLIRSFNRDNYKQVFPQNIPAPKY